MRISELIEQHTIGEEVYLDGWVRTIRKSKNFAFMNIADGSCQQMIQIIMDETLTNYSEVASLLTGSSVSIKGNVKESQGRQDFEIQATEIEILGPANSDYPLQKKGAGLEFLRDIAHLRPRTNLFGAIYRIRHQLTMATHQFFDANGFFNLHTPIITTNDCEGAGEMFRVTTLPPEETDLSKDYFGQRSGLTVSGQLEAESVAMGLGRVYTFGPTFRSENSNTSRHLSEFWMVEPEAAFTDLEDMASLAELYIKHLISHVLEQCSEELEFLQKFNKKDHIELLKTVRDAEFKKITYTEAIDILTHSNKKFEFKAEWGIDLQSEHERFLAEEHFKVPVIVTDYPKDIKSFYMKQNDDGKTVRAMDILAPGIGEIIGGSQREESYEKLSKRMDEMGMDKKNIEWFLELRKFGTVPHSGFGLGFERMMMYVTGMSNIRDVIPFPRTPGNAKF